jgi:hypothetical protein
MSLSTLRSEMQSEFQHLLERLTERVDQLGLDEDSKEVKEVIEYWFGPSVLEGYEDWIRE